MYPEEPLVISGPALALRYPVHEDAPALFALGRDPEVTRFFAWGPYREIAEPEHWIARAPARRAAGELLEFAIVHPEVGPIGITSLAEPSRRDGRATVGTWLGREWWGTGANAESKALVAALAFGPLGLIRLTALASTQNPRSPRARERLGFRHEGVLRSWHRHGEEIHDLAVFGLLRAEWEASPLSAVPVAVRGEPPEAWVAR
jgi:ribosomal-protein-alanine N-acetyltransferase